SAFQGVDWLFGGDSGGGAPRVLVISAKLVWGRASASSLRMAESTSVGSATGAPVGPRCQPSAMAKLVPDTSMICSVTSDDSFEASQTQTGATQRGSRAAFTSSEIGRSSVMRVSAPGAMALTVTPYRASSRAAMMVRPAIPDLAAP